MLHRQGLGPKSWSDSRLGDAAVGQNNGIAKGFDLLSEIAFPHIFQLNSWSDRCYFLFRIFLLTNKVNSIEKLEMNKNFMSPTSSQESCKTR